MNTLHRFRFVLLAATAIVLVAATVMTLRDTGADPDEVRGHLGPTPGPSSEGYIRAKRTYLEGIATTEPAARTAALVSLKGYAPAPGVQDIAGQMEAVAVWVRFPAAEAELVLVETTIAGAVSDAAAAHRDALDAEIEDLTEQLETATAQRKTELGALIAERKTALEKSSADCGCVFAFSVEEAQLGDLLDLLERPAIRHVDVPDPVTNDLSGWELQPIVPSREGASDQPVP